MNNYDVLVLIGNKIAELRKTKGITQLEMAYELGLSDRQYRRIESCGTPDLMKIGAIADILGVDYHELLPLSIGEW